MQNENTKDILGTYGTIQRVFQEHCVHLYIAATLSYQGHMYGDEV